MSEDLEKKLAGIKPIIRSILLALGRRASEREFRKEYFNQEGESFNAFLCGFGMNFYQFTRQIPDVCRSWKVRNAEGEEEVHIERVSSEASSHMDHLTVVKPKKKKKGAFSYMHPRLEEFSSASPSLFILFQQHQSLPIIVDFTSSLQQHQASSLHFTFQPRLRCPFASFRSF
jgi:hypothetical protein